MSDADEPDIEANIRKLDGHPPTEEGEIECTKDGTSRQKSQKQRSNPLKPRSEKEFRRHWKRVNGCTRCCTAILLAICILPTLLFALILLIVGLVVTILFLLCYAMLLLINCCEGYHKDDLNTALFPVKSGPLLIGMWIKQLR